MASSDHRGEVPLKGDDGYVISTLLIQNAKFLKSDTEQELLELMRLVSRKVKENSDIYYSKLEHPLKNFKTFSPERVWSSSILNERILESVTSLRSYITWEEFNALNPPETLTCLDLTKYPRLTDGDKAKTFMCVSEDAMNNSRKCNMHPRLEYLHVDFSNVVESLDFSKYQNVTSLELSFHPSSNVEIRNIPPRLKHLRINQGETKFGFGSDFTLPETLETLEDSWGLICRYVKKFPASLKTLKVEKMHLRCQLPESLISLSLYFTRRESVFDIQNWPKKITDLLLFSAKDEKVHIISLPPSVQRLQLWGCFYTTPDFLVPDHLESLTIQNSSLPFSRLPASIKEFRTGSYFGQDLLNLPEGMTRLSIGFSSSFVLGSLPSSLVHLELGYACKLDNITLPRGLRYLSLGHSFEGNIHIQDDSQLEYVYLASKPEMIEVLPKSLKKLYIDIRYVKSWHEHNNPKKLEIEETCMRNPLTRTTQVTIHENF